MNNRWKGLIIASLMAFASLVVMWQFRHYHDEQDPYSSLTQTFLRGGKLAAISDIWKRDNENSAASGYGRYNDLFMPKDARIFVADMTGRTNREKMVVYYWMTYYLFPREIGTSLDHRTQEINDGFVGTTSESNSVILSNGFDIRVDVGNDNNLNLTPLHPMSISKPTNPDWFDSKTDLIIAFLLPLLTALAGMWLFRFLFPTLGACMPLPEQLAYSLGLGMMAVAALTLGVKLCGFHGRWLILIVATCGAITETWRDRKVVLAAVTGSFRKLVRSPVTAAFLLIGLAVFLILFRIAGLEGLTEGDAMRWMLKAKMFYLYTGNDLVQWFSNPALAHAHFDYPTLVPSLHSATYDSIGHVDEFVTKFWPVWMLLFLLASLASLNRAGKGWLYAPSFALLGLLLLPFVLSYVQMEGSTLPMIFFTVMGFVQCTLWLIGRDRARLGLGLTLLFGGAMTHFEGSIFLALVLIWVFLLPSARPCLKPSPNFWRVLAFCFLAALPFTCLRIQIPSLHFESGWAGYALHNPGSTISNWPGIFMIMLARFYLNPYFATWDGEGGGYHWTGRWDGLSSLYDHSTLGLPWLCLFMTVTLWFAIPARRQVILWILAMVIGALVAFSLVYASFTNIMGLSDAIGYTNILRYLLPVILAWFAVIMTMLFAEAEGSDQVHTPGATIPSTPTSVISTTDVKPARKNRRTKK
jgi:hypothetical protein